MRFILPGLVLAFTVYCVVDVVRSESSDVRGLPKTLWVLLVLLFPLAGGAAWFIAGRPTNRTLRPQPGRARPTPRATGPDDDPDFLRSIRRPAPVDPPTPLDPPREPDDTTPRTAEPGGAGPGDSPSDEAPRDDTDDGTTPRGHEAADDQDSSDRDDRTP